MTTEETIEQTQAFNVEEEFKKMQEQLNEVIRNNKTKDELLTKALSEKEDLKKQYELLSDTHKLLKNNVIDAQKQENKIDKIFKNVSKQDLEGLTEEDKKMLYDVVTQEN